MIRHLRMLDFALHCLWRQRWHNGLTLILHAALVFGLGSVLLLSDALKHEARRLLAAAPEIIVQRLAAGRHEWMPRSHAEAISAIRGVASVTPRCWGYYDDPPIGATYTIMAADDLPLAGTQLIDGRGYGEGSPRACVIGRGVAEARQLDPEDILPVRGSNGALCALRVTDIFVGDQALLTHDVVIVSTATWRELFGVPAELATDLVVQVPNDEEVDTVIRKIAERLPDVRIIPRRSILMTYEAVFGWRSSLVLLAMSGAMAAFGILSWDRARSPGSEERRNLGVLKAFGWSLSDIMTVKTWESLALSLAGFATGMLAAHVHVFHFGGCVLAPLLKGWSVLFPEFRLPPGDEPFQFLIAFLLAVVPFFLAALVPAWTAVGIDPDRILRD